MSTRRMTNYSEDSEPERRSWQRWEGWQTPLSDDESQIRDPNVDPFDFTPNDRQTMNADNEQADGRSVNLSEEMPLTGTENDFLWLIRDADVQTFIDGLGYVYVEDPNPLLVCSICHDPMQEPLCSTACQHSFCRSCLTQWASECTQGSGYFTCPMDRRPMNLSSFQPAPHIVHAMISELRVSCQLKCGWTGPREGLFMHYKKMCPDVHIDMHDQRPTDTRRDRWTKTIVDLENRLQMWRLLNGQGRQPTFTVPEYVRTALATRTAAPVVTECAVVVPAEESKPTEATVEATVEAPTAIVRVPTPIPTRTRVRAYSTPVPPAPRTPSRTGPLPPRPRPAINGPPSTSTSAVTATSTATATSPPQSSSQGLNDAMRDLIAFSEQLQQALQTQTARVEAAAREARKQEEDKARRAQFEKTFRHYAQCFGCRSRIEGHRYRCLICPNTDFCERCFKSDSNSNSSRREAHREHPFFRMDSATSKAHTHAIRQDLIEDHHDVQCQHCGISPINGPRYKCIDARCKGGSHYCNECIHASNYRHPPHHQMIRITMAESKPGWGSWLGI